MDDLMRAALKGLLENGPTVAMLGAALVYQTLELRAERKKNEALHGEMLGLLRGIGGGK